MQNIHFKRYQCFSPIVAACLSMLCLASEVVVAQENRGHQNKSVQAVASVPPLAFLVERIGGEEVSVEVLIPPGRSPHSLDLSPRDFLRLKSSRLILRVGHDSFSFERPFVKTLLAGDSSIEVINLASLVPGPEPHPWLSPRVLRMAASEVSDALTRLDPQGGDSYHLAAAELIGELEGLEERISKLFAQSRCKAFLVDHPAWNAFALQFGLEQVAVEHEGKEPGPASLARLARRVQAEGLSTLFVEPGQPVSRNRSLAKALRCGGSACQVQVLDPLASNPIENLWQAAQAIAKSCSRASGGTAS